jgi:hypothetical protein
LENKTDVANRLLEEIELGGDQHVQVFDDGQVVVKIMSPKAYSSIGSNGESVIFGANDSGRKNSPRVQIMIHFKNKEEINDLEKQKAMIAFIENIAAALKTVPAQNPREPLKEILGGRYDNADRFPYIVVDGQLRLGGNPFDMDSGNSQGTIDNYDGKVTITETPTTTGEANVPSGNTGRAKALLYIRKLFGTRVPK